MDVLVLGVNPEINSAVKNMLEEKGICTEISTNLEQASSQFNARDFKVLCLGAGLSTDIRSSLKNAFKQQNPTLSIVETFPQVAIAHIIRALNEKQGDFKLAKNFKVNETKEDYQLTFELNALYPIQVDLYNVIDNQPIGQLLYENQHAQGKTSFSLKKLLIKPALNLAVISINNEPYFFFAHH